MKKLMIMFLLCSGILFMVGFKASAEETTPTEQTTESDALPNPGVKPGNFFYSFDKFFENVSLRLTFSDEKRVEKLSRFAEERLAELNAINSEVAQKYADELFNEYGLDIEKAHLYVQKLVAEGKISETKLEKIESRIQKAEMRQEKLQEKVRERISEKVRNQVRKSISTARMSIFNQFTDIDLIKQLHEEGYGYGVLLKLQAISELSSTPINDLLLIENAVTTDDFGKHINIDTILEDQNITIDQLQEKIKEYRSTAKQAMKDKIEEVKEVAKQRKNEIRKRIKERKNDNK